MPNPAYFAAAEQSFMVHDDFNIYNSSNSTGLWQEATDGATGASGYDTTNPGGWLKLVTAAAADDYHSLFTSQKMFKIAANKPISFDCRIQLTEANTNKAQLFLGLSSVTTTGGMLASNAGPLTNFDGVALYKTGGTSTFGLISSSATAQTKTANIATLVSGTTIQLGFSIDPHDANYATVTPYVNGVGVMNNNVQVKQTLAYPTNPLCIMIGVIAGSTSAETLLVDYVSVSQAR